MKNTHPGTYVMPRNSFEEDLGELEAGFSAPSKQIGEVKHFYSNRSVAAVELTDDVHLGDFVALKNHDRVIGVTSLQQHHMPIKRGRSGTVVGIKLPEGMKARKHDKIFVEMPQKIGKVTNYFSNLKVVSVALTEPLTIGDVVIFKRGRSFYKHVVTQMQVNHKNVQWAEPSQLHKKKTQVGIKVPGRIKEGSRVYILERGINVKTIDRMHSKQQPSEPIPMLIGRVINAYKKINVLAIKLHSGLLAIGDVIMFTKGDKKFKHMITSMEINHEKVDVAYPGSNCVGIKVPCVNSKHTSDPCSRNAKVFCVFGASNAHHYSQW